MKKEKKADFGIELISEAVVEVLENADKPLTPAEISNSLGIPPYRWDHTLGRDYAITHGVLAKLAGEGKVKYSYRSNKKKTKVWEIKDLAHVKTVC